MTNINENELQGNGLGLIVKDAKVVVSSRMVAQVFEKEHKHVLRDILELQCSSAFRESNFGPSSYRNGQNKVMPEFLMTRDGFTLLAMGYNGERAMRFKEAYINAFNAMERKLTERSLYEKAIQDMYEQYNIPRTLPDALKLAGKLEEERAALAAKVERDAPKVETFDAHYPDGKLTSITDFARTLDGVNSTAIKKSLKNNGYFYISASGRYRPYAQYRGIDGMFVEKHDALYDQYQIFVTNKGMQLITKLFNEGKLIMLKRFVA